MRSVVTLLPAKRAQLTPTAWVLRSLPRREVRRVGPFVFFDHFGPAPGEGMDVPAHPHTGLQTVTYLFAGAVRHRDSLGSEQVIRPGDVNWMTAGRGIVHAERGLAEAPTIHGIQTWIGLPHAHRRTEPQFVHVPAASLPIHEADQGAVRTLAGGGAPVPTFQQVTYLDVSLEAGGDVSLDVDRGHALAVYVADGALDIAGTAVERGTMAHLSNGDAALALRSPTGARAVVVGGEPLAEPTVVYWNFVADSFAEGQSMYGDWLAGRFPRLPFSDD